MKRILSFISDNFLFISTVFLLIFIPLYPKLPLIDVKNTWVYVRVEDFLVLFVLFTWVVSLVKKKVTLKTPLTIPIIAFWLVGAISTIHGVVLIFPTISNVFPNVALLSFFRHIEYASVFFVAYAAMRDKKYLPIVLVAVVVTLLGVIGYGAGQKYMKFPAYLTMNEQYAKGIPIQLSDISRIPSTFAGHYDLAAYLVLILPIIACLFFAVRNYFAKAVLAISMIGGIWLLFETVSRVSFFVLVLILFGLAFIRLRRLIVFALPFIAIFAFLFVALKPTVLARFSNTVKTVDVLVDGKTGAAIGEVKFVPFSTFSSEVIREKSVSDKSVLDMAMTGQPTPESTHSAGQKSVLDLLEPNTLVPTVLAANVSNGETLPQGTGYTNLSLAPVTKKVNEFFYELPPNIASTTSAQVLFLEGNFIVKRASAYDLSFTTRFQGEWPNALIAFQRNVLLGSGYGSISLAIDNNFLRILGETGLLGMISFLALFVALAIYIRKILPSVDSPIAKAFIIGFAAGIVGLFLNATLIDVFEASKIAFLLWLLMGIAFGTLVAYQKGRIDLMREFKNVAISNYAIITYLFLLAVTIFSPMVSNFFVGDDFTWFRWAADCTSSVTASACRSLPLTILHYFTETNGFFWRPGTKIYFLLMYKSFWLNQTVYHMVSIFLDFVTAALFFLLAKKVLKDRALAALSAFAFLIMSGYSEAVFWISSVGFLFNSVAALTAILFYSLWDEKKKVYYLIASLISMVLALLFHEVGVVVPLLIIAYKLTSGRGLSIKRAVRDIQYYLLFIPDILYLIIRFISKSHWQGGDYSYNLIKLPFNAIGNLFGYLLLTATGSMSLPFYEKLRNISRSHIPLALIGVALVIIAIYFVYKKIYLKLEDDAKRVYAFGTMFFVVGLLPFIGLGNISSRYSLLGAMGIIIILAYSLKYVYAYLATNGREIAIAGITLVITLFLFVHIVQLQEQQLDWHGAGNEAQNFFITLDNSYANYWSTEPMQLHFVNVPIVNGDAWVFPTGLNDAVWFAFKNPKTQVSIDSAVTPEMQDKISRNYRVFNFNGDGSVSEVPPPVKITPTPTAAPVRAK